MNFNFWFILLKNNLLFTGILFSIHQRYNLKGIHNLYMSKMSSVDTVFNTSKIQFERNSQCNNKRFDKRIYCFQYIKDTIWKEFTILTKQLMKLDGLFSIHQRYNLKGIHNYWLWIQSRPYTVFNTSKIQFERNSQCEINCLTIFSNCFQYIKDTIWKEFTMRLNLHKFWY